MSDRIKLAEAMGIRHPSGKHCGGPGSMAEALGGPETYIEPFDPFNDANDDYAVMEWIRKQHFVTYLTAYLEHEYTQDYQIGDYAKAAVLVLGRRTHD